MSKPWILGSACTGAGMLDLAVEAALGPVRRAWHSEVDADASAVLDAHYPDVPNLGDLTTVDWALAEPVDILTAGFPCQDVSSAGLRAGIAPGTRSGLWTHIAHAISILRPRLVVIENVPGLLSARAHRGLGPEHEDMETTGRNALRAAGAVLGDLADLGFDAEWTTLTAASIGAPHKRSRVFVIAWPATDPHPGRWGTQLTNVLPGQPHPARRGDSGVALLPTPSARVSGRGAGYGDQPGRPLSETIMRLLPTPRATDGAKGGPNQRGSSGDLALPAAVQPERWGAYAAAITRWETVLGRPAPAPTEPGRTGKPRLNPAFVEWMMGLPPGWVTDHVDRNPALKILGNGVVWQQGAAAIDSLATR